MTSSKSILSQLADIVLKALTSRTPRSPEKEAGRSRASVTVPNGGDAGQLRGRETVRVDPELITDLQLGYSPAKDDAPDSGEIIWTWVPYEENDGRGKDRPVLVIGRQSADRVYAVRMTSKAHDGDTDYLSIGSGAWDAQGRESWVDIEQLYSVHEGGMRREAAVLKRALYDRVAAALISRYGWAR
ncbi:MULTISPECIES: type II toxin-antitoxin system PemK/MazF family toxin [Microbacterium]|uniref:type II toxin-antitoxin system PemK/MazF family toxin n=1 Tax=Microbacterium TaxID=33882 RepID=UPI00051A25C4|nr:type II toxin-antitoxin system PemK/MazF family toxin [Microbacterium profundi]